MRIEVVTSQDDTWIRGKTWKLQGSLEDLQAELVNPWVQLTDEAYDRQMWFIGRPEKVCERIGITTTPQRATEFEDFVEGERCGLDPWYYAAYSGTSTVPSDDILVWILNTVSPELKNREWDFKKFTVEFPFWEMNQLLGLVKNYILTKIQAKEVLIRSLNGENYNEVVRDLKYYQGEDAETFVDAVFAKNPDQVEKAKTDPKLVNWLVGQIMKECRGKVSAPDVQELVKKRLS